MVYCYINNVDIGVMYGLMISIFIGFISYQVVEKRRSSKLLSVTPLAAAVSAFVLVGNGFAFQMPKSIYNASMMDPKAEEFGIYTWKSIKKLNTDFTSDGRKVLVIGDSTAGDFVNIMLEAKVHERAQIRSRIVTSNCGSFFLNQQERNSLYASSYDIRNGLVKPELCDADIGKVFKDNIVEKADAIVVSMNWRDYAVPALRQSLSNLRAVTNAHIYIVGSKSLKGHFQG